MEQLMARIPRWWDWLPLAAVALYVIYTAYDVFVPVVWTRGAVVSRAPDSVVIGISGWKLRECRYHGIQAYSFDANYSRSDAFIQRIDVAERMTTRPRGQYDLGRWSIKPTTGAVGVVVYVHHACQVGDMRLTKLVEVQL